MRNLLTLLCGVVLGVAGSFAPAIIKNYQLTSQPYAAEQGRQISSLSAADIEQLKAGKGWGLAKPAEFNGYPGPAHIMEFSSSLDLTDAQLSAVQGSFTRMKGQASKLGKALIETEGALDEAFRSKRISNEELKQLLGAAENVRAQLRAVHLSAHLEVTPLLSDEQKDKYAQLRGYGADGHNGHGSH